MRYPFGPVPTDADVLWRCESARHRLVTDTSPAVLEMRWYKVTRRTEGGAWIEGAPTYDGKRFVLLSTRRPWACDSASSALESLLKRRIEQIQTLERKLRRAEEEKRLVAQEQEREQVLS